MSRPRCSSEAVWAALYAAAYIKVIEHEERSGKAFSGSAFHDCCVERAFQIADEATEAFERRVRRTGGS